MRWGLFQAAEYINMLTLSGLCVTLFFGGYHFPWVSELDKFGPIWFVLKLFTLVSDLHLAARDAAAPRYDQLMRSAGRCCCLSRPVNALRHRVPGGARQVMACRPEHPQGLRRHA
jgi:NADH-quinone oxidoreductase subunit H